MIILLMYESHNMRHTDFSQVDDSQQDPKKMRRHILNLLENNLVSMC